MFIMGLNCSMSIGMPKKTWSFSSGNLMSNEPAFLASARNKLVPGFLWLQQSARHFLVVHAFRASFLLPDPIPQTAFPLVSVSYNKNAERNFPLQYRTLLLLHQRNGQWRYTDPVHLFRYGYNYTYRRDQSNLHRGSQSDWTRDISWTSHGTILVTF